MKTRTKTTYRLLSLITVSALTGCTGEHAIPLEGSTLAALDSQFRSWVSRHCSGESTATEVEGLGLASARRNALRMVLHKNPDQVLEFTGPIGAGCRLPDVVEHELEHPVDAFGDLVVVAIDRAAGSSLPRTEYAVVLNGRTFRRCWVRP
jgi:hypothetical protein